MRNSLDKAQNFKERRVSIKKTISVLAQSNIIVNEDDASVILDFLYLIAKSHKAGEVIKNNINLMETSNMRKRGHRNN